MSKMSFLSAHGLSLLRKSSLATPSQSNFSRLFSKQSSNIKPSTSFQENMQQMKQAFDKFETNQDGKISKEEYKAMLRAINGNSKGGIAVNTEAEATKAFHVADKDGDGYIDFQEFMALHNGKVNARDIGNAFRVFDSDGDGKISAKELMEVLRRIGEKCSLDSCMKMIREVDRDGDGLIDLNEFNNMMTSTMKLGSN